MTRIDQMTDKRVCSIHTPMRGVEAVVSGPDIAFFVNERRGPVAREPAPMLRIGQDSPFQLVAATRPYLIVVPKDRAREAIEALYSQNRIILRWYDSRIDQHTITLEIGDFGAAYDYAIAKCGWPKLATKRGAFVPPQVPPPTSPAPPLSLPVTGTVRVTDLPSDFPYAWYIQAVRRKIEERWEGRAIQ